MNIYLLLSQLPKLMALLPADRVFPVVLPDRPNEEIVPGLVFWIESRQRDAVTLAGSYVVKLKVNFYAFAADYDSADAIRTALVKDLESFQGSVGEVAIEQIAVQDMADGFAQEINLFRLMTLVEFMF